MPLTDRVQPGTPEMPAGCTGLKEGFVSARDLLDR